MSLGNYLVKNPDIVNEKRVLELGAGTGLSGIVAALIGKSTSKNYTGCTRIERYSDERLTHCPQEVGRLCWQIILQNKMCRTKEKRASSVCMNS